MVPQGLKGVFRYSENWAYNAQTVRAPFKITDCFKAVLLLWFILFIDINESDDGEL